MFQINQGDLQRPRRRVARWMSPMNLGVPTIPWDGTRIARPRRDRMLQRINRGIPRPAHNGMLQDCWIQIDNTKGWFSRGRIVYQKCLGWGGMGIALHYRAPLPVSGGARLDTDFVLKVARRRNGSDPSTEDHFNIHCEIKKTRVSVLHPFV